MEYRAKRKARDDDPKNREKERERERDRDRHRDRNRERERLLEKGRNKTQDFDGEREKERGSKDRDRDREKQAHSREDPKRARRQRGLSDHQRDEFEDMLRHLSVERQKIKVAMAFALDHADCASEVVQVMYEALTLPETPIPSKLARLFLVSDILHNSTAPVPNASAYRTCFEPKLGSIFESFNATYQGITGRMSAEQLKEQVVRVLRVWEAWSLYPQFFLARLQETFLRREGQEAPKIRDIKPEEPSSPAREISDTIDSPITDLLDEQVDGKPLDPDLLQQLVGRNLLALDEDELCRLCVLADAPTIGTADMRERLALINSLYDEGELKG